MIVLATVAAVIASQAVISGAFSVTREAIQLGYLPRMADAAHLAARRSGQIYLPWINRMLLVLTLAVVIGFQLVRQSRRRLRHRGGRHDDDRLRCW